MSDEYTVTKYYLHTTYTVPRELAGLTIDRDEFVERFDDLVVRRLRAYLYGRELGQLELPADWWQDFKLRWFPKWALARWPARMRRLNVTALFPEFQAPERLGTPLIVWDGVYENAGGPFDERP